MFRTVVIDMVERQKFIMIFAAASALIAVSLDLFAAILLVPGQGFRITLNLVGLIFCCFLLRGLHHFLVMAAISIARISLSLRAIASRQNQKKAS